MPEWKQPDQRLVKCSEPSVRGRGLGVINRKYFEPAAWEPLLSTEFGRGQYGKFVTLMVERIRFQESSYDEIKSFVHLVAAEHNCDFMKVAMPHLPELKEQYPRDSKNFDMALLFLLLKPRMHRRSIREFQNASSAFKTYENGLSETEEQYLRRSLFGPDRGAMDSPSMNRLFKSTVELGYPQPALDQLVREAKARGTDIERCCEGLPTNLRMPTADSQPAKFSSSSRNHVTGITGVRNPSTSAQPSRLSWSSATEANGPRESALGELLTELAVGGVDPPVLTTPNTTSTPHEEPNELDGIEDVAASQEPPNDGPPGIRRTPAEREEFRDYYSRSTIEFLNYFQDVGQESTSESGSPTPVQTFTSPVMIARRE